MKTTFIYALTDPRDGQIRYIGKTDKPSRRFKDHLKDNTVTHKTNWIKSVLKSGSKPEILILDEVPREEWDFWEVFYYNYFKGLGFRLTNSCDCGKGASNQSPESIEKRIKTMKYNIENELTNVNKPILKIDINTGEIVDRYLTTQEAANKNNMRKQRMDELLAGKAWKKGGKTIQRIQNKGFRYIRERDYDPNKDYRINARKATAIDVFDLNNNYIKTFDRIIDAAEELKIGAPQINACTKGRQKTAHGYIFKYSEN